MQKNNNTSLVMDIIQDYKKANQMLKIVLLVSIIANIVIVLMLKWYKY